MPHQRRSPKVVSLRKIEANRQNALKSTGPKTPQGKHAIRMNALKHGLLAKLVVIDRGEGKENGEEYEQLLLRLLEDCKPIGALEELLVQEIADCHWRLQRVKRCEVGFIRRALDDRGYWTLYHANREKEEEKQEQGGEEQKVTAASNFENATHIALIFQRLVTELGDENGLTGEIVYFIRNRLNPELANTIPHVFRYAELSEAGWQASGEADRSSISQEMKLVAKTALREATETLENLKSGFCWEDEVDWNCRSSHKATMQLPPKEETDRLLRYETTIRRQLDRAIDQLERLQRHRKGDFVPAPVKIHLG